MCQAVLTQPQAIKGLGGIGKTQIAVEYAYRAREQGHYTHFFWINAATEEAILAGFLALAELLPDVSEKEEKDQRKVIAAIHRWLQACPDPWLLIVDNADDPTLVQPYLPPQGSGGILLTTRATAVGWLAASLEVEQMGLIEGTRFLLHRAQRVAVTDEESNEASNVVIALDGFPLALDQAGAYIEGTGCGIGDYLQLYEQHRSKMLARRGKQATNYPDSVATTWSLSFQQIEQTHPAAGELLRLCAYLSPDHIPEELLAQGAQYWPALLQHAVSDNFTFNELLEALLAFSLVKRLAQERLLSQHRLVQAVQLDRMGSEEQHQWAQRVVYAVNALFPVNPREEINTWPLCQRYLEQVQACDLLIQQYRLQLPEVASLLERAGIYLREHASHNLAEQLFQRALGVAEQQSGLELLQVASLLNNLSVLYFEQGRYEQARPLLERAMHIFEQSLGPHHPQVANALGSLANLAREQGQYEQAEELYRRALAIRQEHLDPHHPAIADTLYDLALLKQTPQQLAEALQLYQQALTIREQVLGAEHPKTIDTRQHLSAVLQALNKTEEASVFETYQNMAQQEDEL